MFSHSMDLFKQIQRNVHIIWDLLKPEISLFLALFYEQNVTVSFFCSLAVLHSNMITYFYAQFLHIIWNFDYFLSISIVHAYFWVLQGKVMIWCNKFQSKKKRTEAFVGACFLWIWNQHTTNVSPLERSWLL